MDDLSGGGMLPPPLKQPDNRVMLTTTLFGVATSP
jgi:hypothetical protein